MKDKLIGYLLITIFIGVPLGGLIYGIVDTVLDYQTLVSIKKTTVKVTGYMEKLRYDRAKNSRHNEYKTRFQYQFNGKTYLTSFLGEHRVEINPDILKQIYNGKFEGTNYPTQQLFISKNAPDKVLSYNPNKFTSYWQWMWELRSNTVYIYTGILVCFLLYVLAKKKVAANKTERSFNDGKGLE